MKIVLSMLDGFELLGGEGWGFQWGRYNTCCLSASRRKGTMMFDMCGAHERWVSKIIAVVTWLLSKQLLCDDVVLESRIKAES